LDEVREQARTHASTGAPLAKVAPGDRVSLSPTGRPWGLVVAIDRKDATVEIGGKRIRTRVGKLYPASVDEARPEAAATVSVDYEPVAETEVHVRGMDRESALEEVSRFIDRAVLTGLAEIKVVHGLGEGVLARAVRDALARDPRVTSFRFGDPMQGGTGVTLVRLR
jgi:DNA mismatch repair protein MutS2